MGTVTLDEKLILLDINSKDKIDVIAKMADNLQKLGYVKNSYKDAVIAREKIYAKELRNRYGVLQLLFDCGKLEEVAERVCCQLEKLS